MKAPTVLALLVIAMACSKKADRPATTQPPSETPAAPAAGAPPQPTAHPTPPAPDAPAATAPDAAGSAAAPVDEDPRTSELCNQVLVKILECAKDKGFLAALANGVDAKRKAMDKKHLRQIVKWHYESCGDLPTAIEFGGFLDHWSSVAATPDAVTSCDKLGKTINAAGGLFGGDVAN